MKITSAKVRKIEQDGSRMKGIASVLLDDSFAVHDIRIIEGDNGLFIAMPSRKSADGEYRDIAHPINSETRTKIQDLILAKYEETLLTLTSVISIYCNLQIKYLIVFIVYI